MQDKFEELIRRYEKKVELSKEKRKSNKIAVSWFHEGMLSAYSEMIIDLEWLLKEVNNG